MATRTTRTPASGAGKAVGNRLGQYKAKRNLEVSGEPTGGGERSNVGTVRRYVIQKHDATRLHYDLRLEMDGVYRSWAVPKGLPAHPGERNLAVEVEDHPLEYGSFEGVIPAGNYGAGTVMLWDRGHYTVSGVEPEVAYRQGKIHLAFAGEKLVGEWTLVRLQRRDGDKHTNWLVIKNQAPEHHARMTGSKVDLSVLSGRTLEQIAETRPPTSASRGSRSAGSTARSQSDRRDRRSSPSAGAASRRALKSGQNLAPARFIVPMKALSVAAVPSGDCRLEIKLDGYRAVAVINAGRVELWSRNRKPLDDYPEIVDALARIPCANAVIDGEIVALDEQGRSRFQLLQNRDAQNRPPIVYYVFDLLHHDGRSLLHRPIEERRIALEVLLGKRSDPVRLSPVFTMKPEELLDHVRKRQLEGIIAKAAGSLYEPDRRSGTWMKCKVHEEQELVIGGFTPPKNSRAHFGAILVGYYRDGELIYAGKVGSGFNSGNLASLHRKFLRLRVEKCPFANLPQPRATRFGSGMTASVMRQVTWIKPELVAQVQFTEWTEDGSLRHPVFLGLREDKKARDVVREQGGP